MIIYYFISLNLQSNHTRGQVFLRSGAIDIVCTQFFGLFWPPLPPCTHIARISATPPVKYALSSWKNTLSKSRYKLNWKNWETSLHVLDYQWVYLGLLVKPAMLVIVAFQKELVFLVIVILWLELVPLSFQSGKIGTRYVPFFVPFFKTSKSSSGVQVDR